MTTVPILPRFETALAENRNVAYVATDDPAVLKVKPATHVSYYARRVEAPAEDFRVESFNANLVRLKTNFSKPQFVVYNDNDHRDWRLYIGGKETPIIRSNLAFKGVWVPAGGQVVEFKFGSLRTWFIYGALLIGINGLVLAFGMLSLAGMDRI